MRRLFTAIASLASIVALAAPVLAAPVTIASSAGMVDILPDQASEWTALRSGSTIGQLDQIRTGRNSWARLLLEDGSVAVLGPESWMRMDEALFEPSHSRVLLRLLGGRMRVAASPVFPGAGKFEVETPTAVAAVQGTEFIVIYDAEKAETVVISISGDVQVLGVLGALGRPVLLESGTTTTVRKGAFPAPATPASKTMLARLTDQLDVTVSPEDTLLAGFTGAHSKAVTEAPSAIGEWPEEVGARAASVGLRPLGRRLPRPTSRDGFIIDQPILEYSSTPPGQTPPGSVTIVIQP